MPTTPPLTEARDVQNRLIRYLQGIGWEFIPRNDLPAWRGHSERQPFLVETLHGQLARLNNWPAGDARLDETVRRLRLLPATLEGHEQFVHALRGHWTAYDPDARRQRNITLIDYRRLDANRFHFSEEVWFEDRDRRRLDMVLYVNGLPLLLVENKSPTLADPGQEGFDQVQKTYTERIPEFIKYPVPFTVCASRLEYGPTWNPSTKAFYRWKVDGRDFGLEELATTFCARDMVLRLVRDYTIFYRMDDALQKYLLRPHQMRVVEKVVQRTLDHLADPAAPASGLEAHTQGSGKTLSMVVAAHLLRRAPALDNPTIFIVVDRVELETQMCQNLEAFGLDAVRAAGVAHLRDLLRTDSRGVIVTTIHKFDRMPENLLARRNVVVLVDEAHRSQEGDLGVYLRAALPNALFFGFTGTPIDRNKVGRGTYATFGHADDPGGVHDRYTINESIEDGTTLPLYYTLAPMQMWLDKPALEGDFARLVDEFWDVVEAEGAATQEALSKLLLRADKLMAVLKAPERIAAIAGHIAEHYQTNVLPMGFKALVVTPDREACALYKQALDRYLPEEWSAVVYSQDGRRDNDLMRRHYLDEEAEKRVRKAFRDPARDPKLLIVTQKLLTGYDAPVAYAMYLDKPLKDHTLLQAIARVNRPHPGKRNGLIVDYIGVFKSLQRALADQQAGTEKGLIDLEALKPRFAHLLGEAETALAPARLAQVEGRIERVIVTLAEPEARQQFFAVCQDLQMAFETLSPDPFLRPYLERYALIAQVFAHAWSYFNPRAEQERREREFLRKTEELIRESTGAYDVAAPLPVYPITSRLADTIAADKVDERVKVINLQRSIQEHIAQHEEREPYLTTLTAEVERIIEQLHQQQISVQTALDELQAAADKIVAVQEERAASSLETLPFALRMVLRGAGVQPPAQDRLAEELAAYLSQHNGWAYNRRLEAQVRAHMTGVLLRALPKPITPGAVAAAVADLLQMYTVAHR